ncbi:MAG: protein kinase, partial [Rickettsiales bacterium]|nr:protein kinase [Rickettsiales bacterium]
MTELDVLQWVTERVTEIIIESFPGEVKEVEYKCLAHTLCINGEIAKIIGRGGFGSIFLFNSKHIGTVTIKIPLFRQRIGPVYSEFSCDLASEGLYSYVISHDEGKLLKSSNNMLRMLNYGNIFYHSLSSPETDGAPLKDAGVSICEYCELGNIRSMRRDLARFILSRKSNVTGLLNAIDLMQNGIGANAMCLHLDIKPDNCFVTKEGVVKIGDFGTFMYLEMEGESESKFKYNEEYFRRRKQFGFSDDGLSNTASYTAPEVLAGKCEEIDLRKIDIFSLGLVFLEIMSCDSYLFADGGLLSAMSLLTDGVKWELFLDDTLKKAKLDPFFKNVIRMACAHDPKKRSTAREIKEYAEKNYPDRENAEEWQAEFDAMVKLSGQGMEKTEETGGAKKEQIKGLLTREKKKEEKEEIGGERMVEQPEAPLAGGMVLDDEDEVLEEEIVDVIEEEIVDVIEEEIVDVIEEEIVDVIEEEIVDV